MDPRQIALVKYLISQRQPQARPPGDDYRPPGINPSPMSDFPIPEYDRPRDHTATQSVYMQAPAVGLDPQWPDAERPMDRNVWGGISERLMERRLQDVANTLLRGDQGARLVAWRNNIPKEIGHIGNTTAVQPGPRSQYATGIPSFFDTGVDEYEQAFNKYVMRGGY